METSDQGVTPVELDPLAAIEALLDGPDDGEPEDEEEGQEQANEEEAEEGEEGEEAQAEEADKPEEKPEEVEEIIHDGVTHKVTKSEMKELAQKGFDYTQKTQQLADQRKDVEAQFKAAQESIALQNQQIEVIAQVKAIDGQLAQFKDVNWYALAESDPVQYLKLQQTFRDLKDARDGQVREFQTKAQQLQEQNTKARQDFLARESKALSESPEFQGEKKAASVSLTKSYLKDAGFSADEISNIADSRMVKVAYEAAQWRKLQQSKPALTKRVAEVPKVIKPGTNKPVAKQADRDAYANLRKTGRGEYAAKLIENML